MAEIVTDNADMAADDEPGIGQSGDAQGDAFLGIEAAQVSTHPRGISSVLNLLVSFFYPFIDVLKLSSWMIGIGVWISSESKSGIFLLTLVFLVVVVVCLSEQMDGGSSIRHHNCVETRCRNFMDCNGICDQQLVFS